MEDKAESSSNSPIVIYLLSSKMKMNKILLTSFMLRSAFSISVPSRIGTNSLSVMNQFVSRSRSPFSTTKTTHLYAAIPEPGPCPECSDTNGYWDGSVNFVCISCGHEWLVDSQDEDDNRDDGVVRDSNGNTLESGDTVVLIKELGKGLKKGLKVTRIRVGDYGDDHDVQANISGLGTFNLKSKFLKKTK